MRSASAQAISRTGQTIDSGTVHRPGAPEAAASTAPSPASEPAEPTEAGAAPEATTGT